MANESTNSDNLNHEHDGTQITVEATRIAPVDEIQDDDSMVSGRRAIIQMLDSLLGEEKNIRTFAKAFQSEIDNNALPFFKGIVMPLLPRKLTEGADEDDSKSMITVNLIPKADQTPHETNLGSTD